MGGLSMEWKEVTLGDFMQCNPKRTIKKGQKARKITMDLLIPHSKTIRNWNYEPYSGGAKFQNGDTIMARITPCLENGKHAFVSILDEGEIAYGSTEYFVFCGKEKVSDNDFVYYLTKTPLFRDTAIKSMVGSSGRQRAQMDVLENLKMFVPKDISDQRRIASILSSLDRKIELNNKINADLEEMAQAIFKNWFVDFEPFKDGKFVDSELGMIPEGWKVGCLGDLITIKYGKDHKKLDDGTFPVYGSGGFMRFVNSWLYNGESVLIPRKGTLDNNMYVSEKFWTVDTMFFSVPKMDYVMKYVYNYIKRFDFSKMNEGTSVPSNTAARLNKMQILIPTHEVLEMYDETLCPIYNKRKMNDKESRTLSTLRDTLLPRLMSGELEVPE